MRTIGFVYILLMLSGCEAKNIVTDPPAKDCQYIGVQFDKYGNVRKYVNVDPFCD